MKTPMQILISELEDGLKQDEIKVSPKELLQNLIWRCGGLLEKEFVKKIDFFIHNSLSLYRFKEVMVNAWMDDRFPLDKEWVRRCAEQYYNETFNTKDVK